MILTITTDVSSGREFALATADHVGGTWDTANAVRDEIARTLRAQGWGVTGSSVGLRRLHIHGFSGFGIEVDGVRGTGRTAAEIAMQSTFTGRD